jgi:hypothetical protein
MSIVEILSPATRVERERVRMECRADGHTMRRQPVPPPGWQMPHSRLWLGAKSHLHKRCLVCGGWRHFAIDYRNRTLTSYYELPTWYYRETGEGRMLSEELRQWELEQVEAELARRTRTRRKTA